MSHPTTQQQPQHKTTTAARLNINSLKSARKEVTQKLQQAVAVPVYRAFHDMYVEDPPTFDELMDEIPHWSTEAPDALESETIALADAVPSIERYIQVIFTTHVMIIAGIKWDEHPQEVCVDVPELTEFVQLLYSYCGEQFSAHHKLLEPTANRSEARQNRLNALKMIRKQVLFAISDLLPTRKTIDTYLSDILQRGKPLANAGGFDDEGEEGDLSESEEEEKEAVISAAAAPTPQTTTVITAADMPRKDLPAAAEKRTVRIHKNALREEEEEAETADPLMDGLSDTDEC